MAETTGKSTRKTSADKAPAARKTRTPNTTDAPAAPKKTSARKSAASGKSQMSAEERYRMVEVAAYFLAERNNFKGNPVEYWTQAEAQISNLLGQ